MGYIDLIKVLSDEEKRIKKVEHKLEAPFTGDWYSTGLTLSLVAYRGFSLYPQVLFKLDKEDIAYFVAKADKKIRKEQEEELERVVNKYKI